MTDSIPKKPRIYPYIDIKKNTKPNRWYAIPLLGILVKIIMIIPVSIFFLVLAFADFFVVIINSFMVLFTGKYWDVAYNLNVGILRFGIKINFFMTGLTDTYPGFSMKITDPYTIDVPKNAHPNRFFAIPLFGFIARVIVLIPYFIYSSVIGYASNIAFFVSWIPVLFKGYFPETTHEIVRDSTRINQATFLYLVGLSDTYPSFWISMNHKPLKILLIILGILGFLGRQNFSPANHPHTTYYYSGSGYTAPIHKQY